MSDIKKKDPCLTIWVGIQCTFIPLIAFMLSVTTVQGQDTLALSLPQADSLFLKNNLFLLSRQFDIAATEALVLQAKAYPNPNFTVDVNAIDRQNDKVFHVDNTGEKAFQLEQLIILGGKRRTEIDMAKQNKLLAESEFTDLLRNLQFELHQSFFNLREQSNILDKYNRQLQLLDTLIRSYDVQANRGNVPLKDAIRLKSVYLKINNGKAEVAALHTEEMKKMQMLLQAQRYFIPKISADYFDQFTITKSYQEILELALQNRPDLKIASQQSELLALNLKYQRKQAIPDIIARGSYDQRGGAFINQVNAGLTVPLPLWNRNRGNIQAAGFNLRSSEVYQKQKKMVVETDVQAAWQNLVRSSNEYAKVKSIYTQDFDEVFRGVNTNFRKRNITILEFVDFFEAYNESLTEYERVKTQLAIATRQINYVAGIKVY
jgi:outer membrane protein, heavy metal efflux system